MTCLSHAPALPMLVGAPYQHLSGDESGEDV
jgi:hypothetical protein